MRFECSVRDGPESRTDFRERHILYDSDVCLHVMVIGWLTERGSVDLCQRRARSVNESEVTELARLRKPPARVEGGGVKIRSEQCCSRPSEHRPRRGSGLDAKDIGGGA